MAKGVAVACLFAFLFSPGVAGVNREGIAAGMESSGNNQALQNEVVAWVAQLTKK